MNWSAMMLMTAGLMAPQEVLHPSHFESYTKAYHAASESHKPMFVVLNPPDEKVANRNAISINELQADPEIKPLLKQYVVVVVDTGTEHGQQVHKAFGSKPLPYVAVIDESQEKQVFNTSRQVSKQKLQSILAKYQNGAKAAALADKIRLKNDCPLCRRNQTTF